MFRPEFVRATGTGGRILPLVVAWLVALALVSVLAPSQSAAADRANVRPPTVVAATASLAPGAAGDQLRVRATVRNPSMERQARSRVTVSLRATSGRAHRVVTRSVAPIPPGARRTVAVRQLVPAVVSAGSYRVQVCSEQGSSQHCRLARGSVVVRATPVVTSPVPPSPTPPSPSTPPYSPAAPESPAPPAPASLVADVADVDLGTTTVGVASASQQVTVTNAGETASGVPAATLDPAAAGFAITSSTCVEPLVPGASCTISVAHTPGAAGTATATLSVGAVPGGTAVSRLSGVGVSPAPALVVDRTSYAFPGTGVGSTSPTATFTVTNTGTAPAGGVGITGASSDFRVSSCPASWGLQPGGTCTFTVRFTPQALGAASTTLAITAGAGGSGATLHLTGEGLPAAAIVLVGPTVFPDTRAGQSTTQNLQVTNTGGAPTTPLSVFLLSGRGFSVEADGCEGRILAPAESCSLPVTFAPEWGGSFDTPLYVSQTMADVREIEVTLSGVATQASLQASPANLSFSGFQDVPDTRSFTVTNNGNAPTGPLLPTIDTAGGRFAVSDGCSSTTTGLQPGHSCTVTVTFTRQGGPFALVSGQYVLSGTSVPGITVRFTATDGSL